MFATRKLFTSKNLALAVTDLVRAANSLNVQSSPDQFSNVSRLAHAAQHQKLMDTHAIRKFGQQPIDQDDIMYKALSSMARYKSASAPFSASPLTEGVTIERINKELTLTLGIERPEFIKFRSAWYSQRTPVDFGLNAYRLTVDCIGNEWVFGDQVKTNKLFKDAIKESAPDGSDWYSTRFLELEGQYDQEDTLDAQDPVIILLRHVHKVITTTAVESVHIPNELQDLTFEQFTWWMSYALTHPYNWAFDRLSIAIHTREE